MSSFEDCFYAITLEWIIKSYNITILIKKKKIFYCKLKNSTYEEIDTISYVLLYISIISEVNNQF